MTDPIYFGNEYGKIIDDVWIVQSHHGPFDAARAPKAYEGQGVPSTSIDHWYGLAHPVVGLMLPEGTSWIQNASVVENRNLAAFLRAFGTSVWEEKHEVYHISMARLMKQHARASTTEAKRRIEREIQTLSASQA